MADNGANSTRLGVRCQDRRQGLRTALLGLLCLLSLSCVAAGPPVLSGSRPGSLRVYPKQIAAMEAARQAPDLSAPAALLADSDAGVALLQVRAEEQRPNASTTKIMTALLALELANLDDQVVIQPTALVEGTTMGLVAGEVVTVADLLWGLLLNSGNDAAAALAEHVAGTQADFVVLMNQRASELGMANTRFVNPHGMDAPGHYSSAADLWRVTEAALAHPFFRSIVATRVHTAAGHPLWNRNLLLGEYPGADGVKTGTTDQAGECLVASVTREGHRVLTVVLGSEDRYVDTEALLDHYFTHYRWDQAPQPVGPTAWLRGLDGRPYRVLAEDPPDLFLASWQWPLVQTRSVLTSGPGDAQPAGEVRWYLGDALLAATPARLSVY